MDRRKFLINSMILAAGIVAVDQLELIDKLGWKRKFFPGFSPKRNLLLVHLDTEYALGFEVTQKMLDDDSMYGVDKWSKKEIGDFITKRIPDAHNKIFYTSDIGDAKLIIGS